MKTIKHAAALTFAMMFSQTVDAAVMTRTYTSIASYDRGPISSLTASATIKFDPDIANSASLISFTGSNDTIFNNIDLQYFTKNGIAAFQFGGGPDGSTSHRSSNTDFEWLFVVDNAGEVLNGGFITYSIVGGSGIRESSSILTTANEIASAVPEPATWAMMLVGFGMVAGTARYRRRNARIVYA